MYPPAIAHANVRMGATMLNQSEYLALNKSPKRAEQAPITRLFLIRFPLEIHPVKKPPATVAQQPISKFKVSKGGDFTKS